MIKSIFNPGSYPYTINLVLFLLRLVAGVFMLTHGIGKFETLFGNEPITFANPIGIGETASLVLAVFAEVLCSILLIFGIATRLVILPLIVTMLVAVLIVHANDGFDKKELPLFYLLIYFSLAISGAGKISLDHWIYHTIKRN